MKTSLIITDDFYNNPDETRDWALAQDFNVAGNFPGNRTAPVHDWDLKDVIQKIIFAHAGKITYFDDPYTTAFQYTTEKDSSWIHADQTTMWAGVCYLTPNAPSTGGTGLFRHKETGWETAPLLKDGSYDQKGIDRINADARNDDAWEMTAMTAPVYNRLVLYRGDMFHTSLKYFGKDRWDGRLFQTFFFNTEH
jgi:hypothetical protein